MDIKKCDLCKNEITNKKNYVSVRFAYDWIEFCEECASPVLNFLKRNKFIEKENKIKKV